MSCPACEQFKPHPTHFPDVVRCIKCKQIKQADHNHVMCRDCERGR